MNYVLPFDIVRFLNMDAENAVLNGDYFTWTLGDFLKLLGFTLLYAKGNLQVNLRKLLSVF